MNACFGGAAAGEGGGVVISVFLGVGGDCGAGCFAGFGVEVFFGVIASVEGISAGVDFSDGAEGSATGLGACCSLTFVGAGFALPVPSQGWQKRWPAECAGLEIPDLRQSLVHS